MVCSAVAGDQVRYLCGVFWRGKEDTEPFFKILRAGEYGLPFQPFWTEEPQYGFNNDEVAAVAAHFNVVQQDASYVAVYTAHLVALGPSVVKRPWMSEQPAWSDKLFPCGSSIEKGLRTLSNVPQLRQKNEGASTHALPLTQQKACLDNWTKGVHQVLLWVGDSRSSIKCASSGWAAGAKQWRRSW